jgi:hypothetical protein
MFQMKLLMFKLLKSRPLAAYLENRRQIGADV